jgi:uroporphyrinogen-III synthase
VRILLTRPEGRNEKLAQMLRPFSPRLEVICEPLIAVEPLGDEPIDLEGFDWLIITSVTGAREIRRRGRGCAKQVAAVGQATADAYGGVDLVPRISTQEGLLAELPRPAGRVLFAGAEKARPLLVDELGADFVPLYRTRELRPDKPLHPDLVVLASPSAARAFAALGLRAPAVSIGPETTAAAKELGIRVIEEAPTQDVRGLAHAVLMATR